MGNMDDQRVKIRPSLHLKDSGHGKRIEGIRAQTINRLCWEGNDPPFFDDFCGVLD
jgi:hypothetical protein